MKLVHNLRALLNDEKSNCIHINHLFNGGGENFEIWGSWPAEIHRNFPDLSIPDQMQWIAFCILKRSYLKCQGSYTRYSEMPLKFPSILCRVTQMETGIKNNRLLL